MGNTLWGSGVESLNEGLISCGTEYRYVHDRFSRCNAGAIIGKPFTDFNGTTDSISDDFVVVLEIGKPWAEQRRVDFAILAKISVCIAEVGSDNVLVGGCFRGASGGSFGG